MQESREVAFYTLGCKLNFAETSTIERLFTGKGFRKVDFNSRADVYVINTCSVTSSAEKKCRNIINKAIRRSPGAYIIVVGCYSQLKAYDIAKISGVDLVLGSDEKFRIFDYAGNFKKGGEPVVYSSEITDESAFTSSYSLSGRTRSFLKIQDGCDYFCSYCTIPLARGRSRSASIEEIILQANKIAECGVKEVVLTGVNIGDFGRSAPYKLPELLIRLQEETVVERYRISSVEPDLLNDEIISLVAQSQKFAPHFHLPLQSGCDRILKSMNRKYRKSLFTERVEKIREKIPDAGIGADVITGFPGETEMDFNETAEFLQNADIAFLHIFSYSERNNTIASKLPGKVPPEEKEQRSKILHRISEEKHNSFLDRCRGQTHKVLFEEFNKKGRMLGFTGNYIRVEAPGERKAINSIIEVKLLAAGEDGIMKGMVKNNNKNH